MMTTLPLSPLPCEPPRAKEHCCRYQMTHMGIHGAQIAHSLSTNTPFPPSCYALSPEIVWGNVESLDNISIAVTDKHVLKVVEWFCYTLVPFSLLCVLLCTLYV